MLQLPINNKELEIIMESLKSHNNELYQKLWSYKMNYLCKHSMENKNGIS